MFTSGGKGKEGHTWPRSVFKSGKNHLICARRLSFKHNEKPDLRLNSTGETPPEEEYLTDTSGFIKKTILGDIPVGSVKNLNEMPCQNNSYQRARTWPVGSLSQNSWLANERSPPENGYNFNMAQKSYRYPAFGVGCRPIPPWQQYNNGWGYPWLQGGQTPLCGNPFGGNGYAMGYAAYHQGMPFIAGAYPTNNYRTSHRQSHKKATQNVQSQEKNNSAKKPVAQKNGVRKQVASSTVTDVNSVANTLNELHIASEMSSSKNDTAHNTKAANDIPVKMYINAQNTEIQKTNKSANDMDSDTKMKKDIPSLKQKVCDNCKKCSRKEDCVGVGYCLLTPSSRRAKLTLILGNKENVGKLSNTNGKNGYHEKVNMADPIDSDGISDETVSSQSLNDHLHHDQVYVGDITSSHSPPGSKSKCDDASTASNPRLLAEVLLQRQSGSSKRRQHRPSARKRQKVKVQHSETNETAIGNTKQKVNHQVPSTTQNTSKTCSTIAYILGLGPCQKSQDARSASTSSTEGTEIHCKMSVQPDKFSFTISSSEDTDFSDDDDDDVVALSEDDADIWNSFNKCDDPYNPLNFLTSTCSSTPKGIPKSNSAPSLLSPEFLQNDDVWKKDTPPFSPPKPEALTRTAKKVCF